MVVTPRGRDKSNAEDQVNFLITPTGTWTMVGVRTFEGPTFFETTRAPLFII